MMADPWLITRMWDYLLAVTLQWWGGVAAVFFLMRLAPILFPSSGRAVEWLQRERQVFLSLAMILFVVSNFRVFDQDQRDLRALRASPASSDWSTLPKCSTGGLRSGQLCNNGGEPAIVP